MSTAPSGNVPMGAPVHWREVGPCPPFLAGDSELARLIREKDWSQTPLGPIANWPEALKTATGMILSVPQPMWIGWGPRLVQIYNDAFLSLLGAERHPLVLGQPVAEAWAEIWHLIKPDLESVLAGGPTVCHADRLVAQRRGYFSYSYSPVPDVTAANGVGGVLCLCIESTPAVALRESEERKAFLLKLSDALRQLVDPLAVQAVAAERTLERLDADRCYYCEVAGDAFMVRQDWAKPGLPSLAGSYPLDTMPTFREKLLSGEPLVIGEVNAQNTPDDAAQQFCAQAEIAAYIATPLLKNGELVGIFVVAQAKPREWSRTEVRLAGAVAERTWAAVLRARAEIELREHQMRLRHILDSAREYAILTLDRDGRIASWNAGAQRLLGYNEKEVIGQRGDIFFVPEDRAADAPEREMKLAREQGRAVNERWHLRKDGTRFWGSGVMVPVPEGQQDAYLKIFRDNTETRRAEQRQALLIHELNHRVKNTLTIIQSIVMQTLRTTPNAADAREALESRLVSLAQAHNILTSSDWRGGDLRELVTGALAAYACTAHPRFHIRGEPVALRPKALLALSMAVHELATNAVKYGALSNESGHVEICWEITPEPARRFCFHWKEQGGPPVEAPRRRGFGSRLVEEGLAQDIAGEVHLRFAREGLECTIEAPVMEIASMES